MALLDVSAHCHNYLMADKELTPNQIEFLSWDVMSEVLRIIAEDVFIADLEPGGGQYDCLSLVTSTPEIVLMLNRNGTSAASGGESESVSGIWERAITMDTRETALHIMSELNLPADNEYAKHNRELIKICKRIAYWVRSGSKGLGKAKCCWVDGTYGAGPAGHLLSQVVIPESWKLLDAPYRGSDWSALIYAMTLGDEKLGDKVVGLVNMKTGEAINPDGSSWVEWQKPLPAVARIVPRNRKLGGGPKIMQVPYIAPHPDGVAAFRTLKNFNGYKVMGEDLAPISNAIAEQWYEDETLPTEVDQLKGTLFYMSRKAKFIDGFPDEEDVPFLQALVAAIAASEK